MKRFPFIAILLCLFALGTHAQSVTVTGHLKSGNTTNVVNKAFLRFRLRNFSGNTPRVTGTGDIVQTQFDVTPDNTGTVTTTIYGNDQISPVNTFWTVETWYNGVFQFSYNYGICFSTTLSYCGTTGATLNLDTASPISFPTPPSPYLPLPGPTGPTGATGPAGPQGPPGPAGGGGSGPALQTNSATNTSQTLLNLKNGSNTSLSSDGSGGVTVNAVPTNPTGCLQYNNAGAFGSAAGLCTPDGNNLTIKGPSPWVDITAYGARVTSFGATTTATCASGSPNITLASIGFAGNWVNGDGLDVYGCGATNTLSTPSAPTVAPVFASGPIRSHMTASATGGATNYWYKVFACDLNGGCTAPSAATKITTGFSSLGLQTASASAASRSNDTETVTVTTPLTFGAVVQVGGNTSFSNNEFGGWFQVCTNPGTTLTFCSTPFDSRAMPTNYHDQTSITGTSDVSWYQGNKITWSAVTGATKYYICGSTDGVTYTLTGQSMFNNSATNMTNLAFEDWGSTYMANQAYPYYISNANCTGSATNDPLITTIVSGAGTTSLVVANNASQNVASGATVIHDETPNILAAMTAASALTTPFFSATVYIPPTIINSGFQLNSPLVVPQKISVKQAGNIIAGASPSLYLKGNVNWDGSWSNAAAPQFSTNGNAIWNSPGTVSSGNPIAVLEGIGNVVQNLVITSNQNHSNLVTTDNFNGEMRGITFNSYNGSSNDTGGIDLLTRDTTQTVDDIFIRNSAFLGGPDQVNNKSWTPLVMTMVPSGFLDGMYFSMNQINWSKRGFARIDQGGCGPLDIDWTYRQAGITPMFTFANCGSTAGAYIAHERQDTEGQPIVFNMSGANPEAPQMSFTLTDVTGGVFSPIISGVRPYRLQLQDYTNSINNTGGDQNRSLNFCTNFFYPVVASPYETGSGNPATESICRFNMPIQIVGGYSIGANLNPPTSITATGPTAGGSIPNGTYFYTVTSVGFDGGETMAQPTASTSVTTTTGNNTVTVGWTPALGAISQNVYRCQTSCTISTGAMNSAANWYRVATGVTGTSFVDTTAPTIGTQPSYVTSTGISGFNNKSAWAPYFACPETSAPTGTASFDILYCDSTNHALSRVNGTNAATPLASMTGSLSASDCINIASITLFTLQDAGGKCAHYTITPTNGDCVTWSGTGGLLGDSGAACGAGAGGMDTNMDNMANPTLMNHSLVPASANTIAVGTQALPFTNVFIGTVANQAGSFDTSALTANHVIKFPNADATAVQNCASVSHEWITQILQSTGACTQTQPTLADIAAGASPAGLFNFAASTMEIPQGAGFTAAANSTLGIDTTAKALHSWINAADSILTSFASAPAGSKCVQTSGTIGQLAEAAGVCGTTTPSSTDTFTNKTENVESTGNAFSEPVRAYFQAGGCNNSTPANGFDIGVTNAPTPQCAGTTVRKGVLQFARGNVAYLNWHLPPDWNSSAATDIEIAFTTTDTTNGHVTSFNVQTGCNAVNGTATDDPSLNGAQALSKTTGASQISGGELTATLTGMTMTGCAADDNFEIAITRNNSGTDTNTDTAVAVKSAEIVTGVTKNAANR